MLLSAKTHRAFETNAGNRRKTQDGRQYAAPQSIRLDPSKERGDAQ
jgi:hypothetical protein